VQRLSVTFQIPERVRAALGDDARQALERAARTCPVALSLSDSVEVAVTMPW
jgi:organic hydroperoxide reductase OsmC/OhrA